MKKFMFVALAMILTLSAFSVQVRPAQAAPVPPGPQGRVLDALLSGPPIDGVVPDGLAHFVAAGGATSLSIGIVNLNLPDFTCLNAAFGRTVLEGIGVRGGAAFVSLSPSPEEIHLGENITISVASGVCGIILPPGVLAPAAGTVILSGTFQAGSGTK